MAVLSGSLLLLSIPHPKTFLSKQNWSPFRNLKKCVYMSQYCHCNKPMSMLLEKVKVVTVSYRTQHHLKIGSVQRHATSPGCIVATYLQFIQISVCIWLHAMTVAYCCHDIALCKPGLSKTKYKWCGSVSFTSWVDQHCLWLLTQPSTFLAGIGENFMYHYHFHKAFIPYK